MCSPTTEATATSSRVTTMSKVWWRRSWGKKTGVCAGIGGSQHLHQDRFYSNGIQGGIVPVAAGLALAQKMEASGGICVVYIGDGTLGEGVLYEAMNLIAKWELPLLVVLENNFYAQSTHQSQTLAG